MEGKIIITIARQYGSGGRDIGKRVSEILDIPFYNRELITMSANECNMHPKIAENIDEKAANSLLYTLAMGSSMFGSPAAVGYSIPLNDKLFIVQSDVIRKLAEQGSCVIVGRCADYVLRDDPDRFSVFIYAEDEARKKRVAERRGVSESEARELIVKTDRRRSNYYNFYTGKKWGKQENYHLMLDSSMLGIEGTAQIIASSVLAWKKEKENTK